MAHTHRYIRIRIGKRHEMKCSIPTCTHHIHPELAIGRMSLCCNCGAEFILTRYNIKKHANPKCLNCIKPLKDQQLDAIKELLGDQ